jgi:archaetidylinositol phosphate synthase
VRALLPLRVPPPAVALVASATGIAAAVEIARGAFVAAAALLVVKTVLDNADGQLARAAGRVTPLGRYLDSESDLFVDAALFAGLGWATNAPGLAAAAFVVLTAVLSVNFNLRRLYLVERGHPAEAMPDGGGAVRRLYELVYAPQDRLVDRFVAWRVRGRDGAAYHDRATIWILHQLGLSGQLTALAVCLALGSPRTAFWIVLACGALLVPLELRRGLRAA